jgi:hypothetical protein
VAVAGWALEPKEIHLLYGHQHYDSMYADDAGYGGSKGGRGKGSVGGHGGGSGVCCVRAGVFENAMAAVAEVVEAELKGAVDTQ